MRPRLTARALAGFSRSRPGRLTLWAAAALVALEGQWLLEDQHLYPLATLCLFAGVLLIAGATRGLPSAPESDDPSRGDLPGRLRRAAIPLLVFALGLAVGASFRFYHLASTPYALWFDEAQNGLIADRILNAHYWPLFITGYVGTNRPALPVYVFAAAIKLFGHDVFSIRSVSAGAGVATLFALFFLARELFGLRVAAIATFLLAVMRWHLTFSRLAMEPIWGPCFAVLAVLFFVRGARRRRWYEFAASGVFVGLGLYFYWAFVLVPALLLLYAAHVALIERPTPVKALGRGIGLTLLLAFMVYSPIVVYATQHPAQYKHRAEQVTITRNHTVRETIDAVLRNTRRHVLMFNSEGDHNARHNLSGAPELDTLMGVGFVLGLGICFARARRPAYLLLPVWLVVLLQPAIWSNEAEAPQSLRSILATPAVAMLAALPLAALWELGVSSAPSSRALRRAGGYALSGGVALTIAFVFAQVAYTNAHTYFAEQQDRALWPSDSDVTFVAKEANRLGPSYRDVISPGYAGRPTLPFLSPLATGAEYPRDMQNRIPLSETKPTAVFLDGAREFYRDWLRALYPSATSRTAGPTGPDQVFEVTVPTRDIDALRGIEGTYTPRDGATVNRRERALDLDWRATTPVALPFDARWSGVLRLEQDGAPSFHLEAPGSIALWIDGQLVAGGRNSVTAPAAALSAGYHRLQISATIDAPGRVSLRSNGEPLAPEAYYSLLSGGQGLFAQFFESPDWSGKPRLQRIDPMVGFFYQSDVPTFGVSSVTWTGSLAVPAAGLYAVQLQASAYADVAIDGEPVLSTDGRTGRVFDWQAGRHRIVVRFRYQGGGFPKVLLYWTRPGQQEPELIPPRDFSAQ